MEHIAVDRICGQRVAGYSGEKEVKSALITTTINVPKVLDLYRSCSGEVMFFVTGDRKTPDLDVVNFLDGCGHHLYLGAGAQNAWKCSELIGWNTIARRNIALLEALAWGADIIISVDDDNLPLSTDYFDRFESVLSHEEPVAPTLPAGMAVVGGKPRRLMPTFSGLSVQGKNGWFDPGSLFVPPVRVRGYPHQVRSEMVVSPVANVNVGVATGPVLGNSDIGAVERIAKEPVVTGFAEIMRSGAVIDNNTWTVVNTQNTAYLREFAPCFLMIPAFERNDDIYASLVVQRIMRDRGYHVHYGQPFVFQERNEHDLMKDLRDEIWGMGDILNFAKYLDGIILENKSVIDDLRAVWSNYNSDRSLSVCPLASAFLDDCEEALK
jgi:hypothetical protein